MKSRLLEDPELFNLFSKQLYHNAINPVFIICKNTGQICHANQSAFETLHLQQMPASFSDLLDSKSAWPELIAQLEQDSNLVLQHDLKTANKQFIGVESHFYLFDDYICCISHNINEINSHIEQANLLFSIFDNTTDAIMVTNADNIITHVNHAFERVTGYSKLDTEGQNPSLLSSQMHDKDFYQNMWRSLNEYGSWQGEIWNRRKDGEVYPEWLTIDSIYDQEGQLTQRFAIFSDLSQQKRQEELIKHKSYYDALTNLPNRIMFYDRLINAVKLAKRHRHKVALLFLDLDMFSLINDTYGHFLGDKLLKQVSERLQHILRKSDTLARFGGDEFVIIANNIKQTSAAQHIADVLLSQVKQPFVIDGHEIFITASIGIALFPDDSLITEELVSVADQTLYHAKQRGRNQFQFYTASLGTKTKRKLKVKDALLKALSANELYPVYQPIVDVNTLQVKKFEVLARWYSNSLEEHISPAEFIPIAEEYGLIQKLGEQIAEQALTDILEINQTLNSEYGIAINRSVKEFSQPQNYARSLETLIADLNIPFNWVTVEITESMLMDEHTQQNYQLSKWQELGSEIAIDDFGTGFSALSYLTQYPIDIVKIDQSFIRLIDKNPKHKHLIEAIIKLTKTLKLATIVEGVETESQFEFVKACGADYIQGYYFSKPLEKAQAIEFINQHNKRLSKDM